MAEIALGLQLYTVRDLMARDPEGTINEVREIGYEWVELSTGWGPAHADEARRILDGAGLQVAAIHSLVGLEALEGGELADWTAFCKALGTPNLVGSVPDELTRSRDGWIAAAERLDMLGARCRDEGVNLLYHNHSFEFVKFDGAYGLDLLYQHSSPDNVQAELDTFWVKHGGEDPASYIQKYSGRVPVLHIKDMLSEEERTDEYGFAEIGRGILDWQGILDASIGAGVECFVVEQDTCPGDPLDSARASYEFTRDLLSS